VVATVAATATASAAIVASTTATGDHHLARRLTLQLNNDSAHASACAVSFALRATRPCVAATWSKHMTRPQPRTPAVVRQPRKASGSWQTPRAKRKPAAAATGYWM